jgi:hypothetical protein
MWDLCCEKKSGNGIIFVGAAQNCEQRLVLSCLSVCPSVCAHGTIGLPPDGLSWDFLLEYNSPYYKPRRPRDRVRVQLYCFFNLGARWGGWSTPCLGRLTPEKDLVPIVLEAWWNPVLVWTVAENFAPTGIRSLDRAVGSESLYPLNYPGSPFMLEYFSKICSEKFLFKFRQEERVLYMKICVRLWYYLAEFFSEREMSRQDL